MILLSLLSDPGSSILERKWDLEYDENSWSIWSLDQLKNAQKRGVLLLWSITDLATSFMILSYAISPLYLFMPLIITVLSYTPIFCSISSRNSSMISSWNWASSPLLSRVGLCWIFKSSAFLYLLIPIVSWWVIVVKKLSTCWAQEKKNDVLSLCCTTVFSAYDFAIANFYTPARPYIHSK